MKPNISVFTIIHRRRVFYLSRKDNKLWGNFVEIIWCFESVSTWINKTTWRNSSSNWIIYKRKMSGTSSENKWKGVVQQLATIDIEQKRVTKSRTSGNKWYNQWCDKWQRVTQQISTANINFGENSFFFRIMWYWYEYLKTKKVISLCQRLLQTIVIAVFKIYINLLRNSFVLFLKVTKCYF